MKKFTIFLYQYLFQALSVENYLLILHKFDIGFTFDI